MTAYAETLPEYIQGTPEWLELRKTKITATDAPIILGKSHWKTKIQLYHEKLNPIEELFIGPFMQRGLDLEPMARALFTIKTGIVVLPKVIVHDWAMASLDGFNEEKRIAVEIKCPGKKDHDIALSGKIPDHYYPQLQHQMWVCGIEKIFYFSFDGLDGVIIEVKRDEEFISKMIEEEYRFYLCLLNKTQPEPAENDYVEREDAFWQECALKWKNINAEIKKLEHELEEVKNQLIFLSDKTNTKGAGLSLCYVSRKGNIDYTAIPELKTIDLEKYRKPTTSSWRIMCNA